jgi:hypothetical protein
MFTDEIDTTWGANNIVRRFAVEVCGEQTDEILVSLESSGELVGWTIILTLDVLSELLFSGCRQGSARD